MKVRLNLLELTVWNRTGLTVEQARALVERAKARGWIRTVAPPVSPSQMRKLGFTPDPDPYELRDI